MAGGLDPFGFWCLTLREINWCLSGVKLRNERDHKNRAWVAYQTAWLITADFNQWPSFDELASLEPIAETSQTEKDTLSADILTFARKVKEAKQCQ